MKRKETFWKKTNSLNFENVAPTKSLKTQKTVRLSGLHYFDTWLWYQKIEVLQVTTWHILTPALGRPNQCLEASIVQALFQQQHSITDARRNQLRGLDLSSKQFRHQSHTLEVQPPSFISWFMNHQYFLIVRVYHPKGTSIFVDGGWLPGLWWRSSLLRLAPYRRLFWGRETSVRLQRLPLIQPAQVPPHLLSFEHDDDTPNLRALGKSQRNSG